MSEQAGQACGPGGSWQWNRRVQAGSGGSSRPSAGLRSDWSGQDRLRAGWERPMQGRRLILVRPQEQPRGWTTWWARPWGEGVAAGAVLSELTLGSACGRVRLWAASSEVLFVGGRPGFCHRAALAWAETRPACDVLEPWRMPARSAGCPRKQAVRVGRQKQGGREGCGSECLRAHGRSSLLGSITSAAPMSRSLASR